MNVDAYIVDTLMPDLTGHDRQPSAFLVFLYLYRWTIGSNRIALSVSLRDIAEATGLSKRTVQKAIDRLHRRRLIGIKRDSITAIPEYRVFKRRA